MMRIAIAGMALVALGACDRPAVKRCEAKLKSQLKAPATYQRVSAEGDGGVIKFVYDSQNGYGALIRGKATCYDAGGRPDIFIDS